MEGPTRRDTLAALFWPESADSQARASLRRTLSALRAAMGGDVIDSDRQQVRLTDQVQRDTDIFAMALSEAELHEHGDADVCRKCIPLLSHATGAYRGDFLSGFSLRATPEFDDWTRITAESYRLACEKAYERLVVAYASDGDYRSAIQATNSWLELDTLREPAYRQLMLLHAWAGDRAGASEVYRRCVATLNGELGVEPLEETTELHEAILDDDLPPAPGLRRRIVAKAEPEPIVPSDLINREEALEILGQAAIDREGGRVIRMVGDAWMGKTRLLEELTIAAGRERRACITARGYRAERQLPQGVVSQLLTSLTNLPEWGTIRKSAPDWALEEAGRVHPSLGQPSQALPADAFGETRLYDAILTVFSSSPLLLVVDDVQWVDAASASFLAYLAHRVADTRLLVVLAHRPDDSAALATVVEATTGPPHHETMLSPLTADQLAHLAGDKEEAENLVTRTGGIPALVAEALADPDGRKGLPGVRRFMDVRLADLDDLTRQILAAAAVLNGTCDIDLLRETSGRSEEEATAAAETLLAKRILTTTGDGDLGFSLDSMEHLVYQETNLVRRRLLHRRAAAALETQRRARTDAVIATAVAQHHREGGHEEPAAEWYLTAGDLARQVFASTEAIDAYRSALALGHPSVFRLHLALGDTLLFMGLFSDALGEFEKAAAQSEGSQRALAEHHIGEALRRLGRLDAAIEQFETAQPGHPDPVSLHCDWALALLRAGHRKEAREQADRAVVASTGLDAKGRSRALSVLGIVSSHRAESRRALGDALELAGDDPILRMAALNALGFSYAQTGEDAEATDYIEEALEIAQTIGDRHRQAALYNHLADLQHRAGRTEDAEASMTEAVKLFVEVEPGSWEPEVWLLTQW